MKNAKRGDVVVILAGAMCWHFATDAELEERRRKDAAAGRFFDSAGEPLLYSRIRYWTFDVDTVATVVRTRSIEWPHWTKKPTGLIECFATLDGIPRFFLTKRTAAYSTAQV